MELVGWYGILAAAVVLVAVVLRFSVYTALVRFNGWLPEKATKVANMTSCIAACIGLAAIVGKAVFFSH